MNRSKTGSPKLNFIVNRSTTDIVPGNSNKLPLIKERSTVNLNRKFFMTPNEMVIEEVFEKSEGKNIKFIDIKPPIDDQKLSIVKKNLEKRKKKIKAETINKKSSNDLGSPDDKAKTLAKTGLDYQILSANEYVKDLNKAMSTTPSPIHYINIDKIKNINSESTTETLNTSCKLLSEVSISSQEILKDYQAESLETLKQNINSSPRSSKLKFQNPIDLKILYEQDISKLVMENYNLEKSLEQATEKIKQLKTTEKSLKTELSTIKNSFQERVKESELNLINLNQEIHEKTQEIVFLKEQLNRSDAMKKRYLESLKDMESEISDLKKKFLVAEKQIEDLESQNLSLLQEINSEKSKITDYDNLVQVSNKLKEENSSLTIKIQQIAREIQRINEEHLSYKHMCDNNRVNWIEKESAYEKIIQDLMDQVNTERDKRKNQVNETVKLKRALASRDTDSLANFSKEELSRYLQKIYQLEIEITDIESENEKLKKNIEYYKCLLSSKNQVISHLESLQTNKSL